MCVDVNLYFGFSVEVIASMSSMGLALGLLEPLCTWFFGFKTSYVVICVGTAVSSALLALFAYYNDVYHAWPSCVGAAQLVVCEWPGLTTHNSYNPSWLYH